MCQITSLAELKEGKLHRFPKKSILIGLGYKESPEKYANLKLFETKSGRWYIYYSREKRTGSFDSKRNAIEWFEKKGR